MAIDPFVLDRQIVAAGRALSAARDLLRDDPEESPPRPLAGHDHVSRRDALVEIVDLAARRRDEPLWDAAIPWMQALTLARATFVDERREALARRTARFLVEAIKWRDYPVVQNLVMFIAVCVVTINFLIDMAYLALDPRIAYES